MIIICIDIGNRVEKWGKKGDSLSDRIFSILSAGGSGGGDGNGGDFQTDNSRSVGWRPTAAAAPIERRAAAAWDAECQAPVHHHYF